MNASMFKLYAVGVAAENKKRNSRELKIAPTEAFPFLDGELVENPTEMGFKGVDEDNQAYEGTVFTDNVINATWLPSSSNRVTAPDVRRGERIEIWRVGDVDQFYWRPMGLDDHLRKLETVIFAISGNPNEGNEVLDIDNCYFIEFSTHTKQVTLSTSTANGEPFAYTFQFNTDQGNVLLQDDIGNEFYMDSAQRQLKLINAMGSFIDIDKKNITINAVEKIHAKAASSIVLETGATKMTLTPSGTTLATPSFKGITT